MAREHRVPLSEAALDLLRSVPHSESPYVFFGRLWGRSLTKISMWQMLRRRLGYREFTVHGFRSCFRDWCADTGKPFDLAEAALAHASGDATVRAYHRTDMLERRRGLMEQWSEYLTRAPDQVVVPIRTPTASAAA
jgi:integrase